MSITRMLILSGFLGLAACTTTTGPSDPPTKVGTAGDPPQGHCPPNGGRCVNPPQ
jgi:hypothetical protein